MSASTQTIVEDAGRTGSAAPQSAQAFKADVAAAAASVVLAATAEASSRKPRCPKGYSQVERSLFKQFTESTGASLVDSGDAYGRGWQRNRRIGDLKAQPRATVSLDFGADSPNVLASAFHKLSENLMCAPAMNRRFARFNRKFDPDNAKSWLDVAEAFAEEIDPEGARYYLSYNDEYSVLGQVVQFVGFNNGDGSEFVLLQVHGGCDVRAGYTKPVAYEVDEVDILIRELQCWSASCSCEDGDGSNGPFLRMDMRYGEIDSDGLDEWPERWAVAPNGTARCGVCREEVLVS